MTGQIDIEAADEFASLAQVAEEMGLSDQALPVVERRSIAVGGDQALSVLVWGSASPELVFLHGGGQNAHTWDLVALGLGRPAIAIDLPGHGHSSWRADRDYWPPRNAAAVATAVEQLAPQASAVVGMSLGGLTTISLACHHPELVRRAVIVDVTPGVERQTSTMSTEQRGTTALIQGSREFDSLDEMVARAIAASPRRPESAVRRGVVNNTRQTADGRWTWRYDRLGSDEVRSDFLPLWDELGSLAIPTMLVRGGDSAFVSVEDVAEYRGRLPAGRVEVVEGAGHSVQSDQPARLVELIRDFAFGG
ncbi:alpha/beta fold hydrolase [Jatrophihabitans sp. DSM 45814]